MNKIDVLGNTLRSMIQERGILARCELLQRIYEAVRDADLDAGERAELEKLVGKRLAPGVFGNILSGSPIFPDFPRLDSFMQIQGRVFHFARSGNYQKEDFQKAYSDFLQSREELLALVRENLSDLLEEFLEKAGYSLVEKDSRGMLFSSKDGRKLTGLIYPRIGMVALDQCLECAGEHPEECVVVVPHEEGLPPFVKFYSDHADSFEEEGIQVWVANMEEGSIDPFIGFTTDMDIYSQFKNPKLAAMVRSTWKK
ncbi:MAG: hypothetical protein GKC10_06570 [Methanosarcinales archaeon]|nr:hypothetical protein [Methanosarcinales archaeon]